MARTGRSPRDMLLSLAVLIVPLAILAVLLGLFRGCDDRATVIDAAPTVERASASNAFPVSAPEGLPSGWRPVSAVFGFSTDGTPAPASPAPATAASPAQASAAPRGAATLRIGYLTPSGDGVQFVQSNVPASELVPAELTDRAARRDTVTINGRTWLRYDARPGEIALVLREPDRTTIVIGAASIEDLRALAAAMR